MIKKINNYQILSKIASGGMANIYLAQDTRTGAKVALKILKDEVSDKEKIYERFSQEGLLSLDHPNIVKILDAGVHENIPYIVMEYIEGTDLEELIKKKGTLSLNEFFYLTNQVLNALSYVHKQGIIHRDIKPKNILIDKSGTAKLTDFGIAKSLYSHVKTSTGSYLGAPAYSSPEQMDGKEVGSRSDIYSLGITLYEMLAGVTPFSSTSIPSLIKEKFTGKYRQISTYRLDVPSHIISVISKCISINPKDRFGSVDELANALNKYENNKTIIRETKPNKASLTEEFVPISSSVEIDSIKTIDSRNKTEKQELEEGEKQLGGIRILLWVFMAFISIGYLSVLIQGFISIFEEGVLTGIGFLIFGSVFYAAISLLYIFPLIGIKNRKPYAVPLVRVILILYCFNLIGLILVLTIFWGRINNTYSKMYLNYFDGNFQAKSNKNIEIKQKKDVLKNIKELNISSEYDLNQIKRKRLTKIVLSVCIPVLVVILITVPLAISYNNYSKKENIITFFNNISIMEEEISVGIENATSEDDLESIVSRAILQLSNTEVPDDCYNLYSMEKESLNIILNYGYAIFGNDIEKSEQLLNEYNDILLDIGNEQEKIAKLYNIVLE